jgi:peptidoglycan/LPS O-acetylase OafA/YrhL
MKQHLPVLDGLRGIAAISVVIFHFQELSVGANNPDGFWLRHAYLAVDFFFCLSGYVIGYAYDDRRDRMTIRAFIAARLIRLHPMVIFGVALGLFSYLFDPFNHSGHPQAGLESQQAHGWMLAASTLGEMLMLPTWPLPNRFGSYFSLNVPSWSLMWEYLASLTFALVLWRVRRGFLWLVVGIAAVALGIASFKADNLSLGFGWGQSLYGLFRVSFSFCMGLLLFRSGIQWKTRAGFVILSALLVLIFVLPGYGYSESGKVTLNWLYDLGTILFVMPLIVLLAAAATTSGVVGKICEFCGRISYPIYVIHYAFIMIFFNYVFTRSVPAPVVDWIIAVSVVAIVAFSYGVLVIYDEPVRRRLNKMNKRVSVPTQAGIAGSRL